MDQRPQLELSGLNPEPGPSPPLEPAFERAFRRLGLKRPAPTFRVTFHPFPGMRSAIRLRGDLITARVADVLRAAPPLVLDAVAKPAPFTSVTFCRPRSARASIWPGAAALAPAGAPAQAASSICM